MVGRSWCVAAQGIDGVLVQVEADVSPGLPAFTIVGMADTAISQAGHRIRAAFKNAGLEYPDTRIVVSLAPASIRKRGSRFDAAIAMALLRARARPSEPDRAQEPRVVVLGELGLDGSLRPVSGVLPALLVARRLGIEHCAVPAGNLAEASLVDGMRVHAAATFVGLAEQLGIGIPVRARRRAQQTVVLDDAGAALNADAPDAQHARPSAAASDEQAGSPPDLADVIGQPDAVEALIVAAAGGHHVSMLGEPGSGKTMLAERLPGLLPQLGLDESLEVTSLRSLSSDTGCTSLVTRPPFQAPHHSLSVPAMVGGGTAVRPGAVSLAHRGVLFLDEAPEFRPPVLDSLRQCLEDGHVRILRANTSAEYPARFQLVLASNPCPCGYALSRDRDCTCTPSQRRRYLGRLSGPLMDRVDMRIVLHRVQAVHDPAGDASRQGQTTANARQRVGEARERAQARLRPYGHRRNVDVPGTLLRGELRLPADTTGVLDAALRLGTLTLRGFDRALRIAWTAADLDGVDRPSPGHVARALRWRGAASA